MLLGKFFLQRVVDQRCWNAEVADLEFRRLKRRVSILRAEMA